MSTSLRQQTLRVLQQQQQQTSGRTINAPCIPFKQTSGHLRKEKIEQGGGLQPLALASSMSVRFSVGKSDKNVRVCRPTVGYV